MSYFNTGNKQYINKIENMGEIITRGDGSKWKVDTLDKFNVAIK